MRASTRRLHHSMSASASLSSDRNQSVTAKSDKPLAYAVMLNQLTYNAKRKRLALEEVQQYVHVLAGRPARVPTAQIGTEDSGVLELEEGAMPERSP